MDAQVLKIFSDSMLRTPNLRMQIEVVALKLYFKKIPRTSQQSVLILKIQFGGNTSFYCTWVQDPHNEVAFTHSQTLLLCSSQWGFN